MDEQEKKWIFTHVTEYYILNFDRAIHLSIQAGLKDIKIDGKSIRVDMLCWLPNNEDFKLVVECDGYKYHSDKSKFVTDRKRDRILKSAGYEVLRYSDEEIMKDPPGAGTDLFDHLLRINELADSIIDVEKFARAWNMKILNNTE